MIRRPQYCLQWLETHDLFWFRKPFDGNTPIDPLPFPKIKMQQRPVKIFKSLHGNTVEGLRRFKGILRIRSCPVYLILQQISWTTSCFFCIVVPSVSAVHFILGFSSLLHLHHHILYTVIIKLFWFCCWFFIIIHNNFFFKSIKNNKILICRTII